MYVCTCRSRPTALHWRASEGVAATHIYYLFFIIFVVILHTTGYYVFSVVHLESLFPEQEENQEEEEQLGEEEEKEGMVAKTSDGREPSCPAGFEPASYRPGMGPCCMWPHIARHAFPTTKFMLLMGV